MRARQSHTCVAALALATTLLTLVSSRLEALPFKRGDVNFDGSVGLDDGISMLDSMFRTRLPLACEDAGDLDDDGALTIADPISLFVFAFAGGSEPPAPFAECGEDPSEDDLGCVFELGCGTPLCLTGELLDELIEELPGFEFCLPAGLVDITFEGLTVQACPVDGATECALGIQGCEVGLDSITPLLDLDAMEVGVRVAGSVEDLPLLVTGSLFNQETTADCLVDFAGGDGGPFSFEIVVPLVTEAGSDGVERIVDLGDPELRDLDLEIAASGGLLCTIFGGLSGLFTNLLTDPLLEATAALTDPIAELIVGLQICPEDEQ